MSWKRANAAGAKQQARNEVAAASATPHRRKCTSCSGFGARKVHGRWYCSACVEEMSG